MSRRSTDIAIARWNMITSRQLDVEGKHLLLNAANLAPFIRN